jgi:glycosyltransferase involved in cell wall biosynthesis
MATHQPHQPLRVLMLSKACLVGIYQRKLELIAAQAPEIDLLALVPPSWCDERGDLLLERVYTSGYCLETLPLRLNGNFHLHTYVGLRERIRSFQPHLVHIDEEPYNLATWQALVYAKQVRAKTLFFSWQNIKRYYPPPFIWGEQWVLNNVDYAIMGTESAAEVWREKGYRREIAVIPQFGTDPDLFRPPLILSDRPFTIGYIGRLVEEKGLHDLLNAVTQLTGEWRLRLLGSGPLREALKAQAAQLGISDRVEFIEQLPSVEMPAQYHKLDVLVLPSLTRPNWKEQFGRVLVEAMSSGVPVIGSNSGAIPDVIGKAGLIFPEGQVNELAQRLAITQHNPELRRKLAQQGRERVLQHFTHEGIASATLSVYRALS